jgi:hypothetical protein
MPKVGQIESGQIESAAAEAQGVRIGICLFDLDRIDPGMRGLLLGGNLDLRRERVVRVDKDRPDETAVPFSCDLLKAASICDVVRGHDREAGDQPTRVYLKKDHWRRLPADALLTLTVDGGPALNPEWFPVEVKLQAAALGRVEL